MCLVLGCLALAVAGCKGGERSAAADAARKAAPPGAAAETGLLAMFGGGTAAPALTEVDRRQVRAAERRAYQAQVGRPVHWQNPQSGTFGEIVPLGPGREQGGQVCREFRHMVLVAGRTFQASGPACNQVGRTVGSGAGERPAVRGNGADVDKQG